MIIVTGAAGFIGSCLVSKLNALGYGHMLVLVDDFSRSDKVSNLEGKHYLLKIDRSEFINWFSLNGLDVEFVFHLGARTDTTEQDETIFNILNLDFSKDVFRRCAAFDIPMVYASSAATYGNGENGFNDDHEKIAQLLPMNPYGWSKQNFDLWVLQQTTLPPFWAGLKFFNVYGPNEYHKGRMASVIFHTFNKISQTGKMQLFRSHRPDFADGAQSRDFVYVMDVVDMMMHLMQNNVAPNGIYNIGTGKARSFYDLAEGVFTALGLDPNIEFIDTPADIRDTYQYFTEASMEKFLSTAYKKPFFSLEDGISDYVSHYLSKKSYF